MVPCPHGHMAACLPEWKQEKIQSFPHPCTLRATGPADNGGLSRFLDDGDRSFVPTWILGACRAVSLFDIDEARQQPGSARFEWSLRQLDYAALTCFAFSLACFRDSR